MEPVETFGRAAKNARLDRKLTLKQAAKELGMSFGNLGDIENGHRKPPKQSEKISKMEELYGLEINSLKNLADLEREKVEIPLGAKRAFITSPESAMAVLARAEELGWEVAMERLTLKGKPRDDRIRSYRWPDQQENP